MNDGNRPTPNAICSTQKARLVSDNEPDPGREEAQRNSADKTPVHC